MQKLFTEKSRSGTSIALIVIAAFVLAGATLAVYGKRNVFEPSRFADHAQATLESPTVRQVAADAITRDVIEEISPDSVAVRPLISSATAALIDTAYFKRIFRSAVLQAHRAAVQGQLGDAALVLVNIGVLVDQSLQKIAPDVAEEIPANFDSALINVAEGGWESRVASVARRTDRLATVLPVLALLLYALALAIAPNRRRALWRAAISVAVTGAALTAIYAFAESVILLQFHEGEARDAASDVWSEFMDGYFILAVGLATAGSALAAAASGSLRPTDVDRRAREIAAAALRPRTRVVGRVAQALALIAVGVWAMADPVAVIRTLGFLLGFLLVFRGANELISLLIPDGADSTAAEGSIASTGRRSLLKSAAAIAGLILALSFAAAALATAIIGEEGLQRIGVLPDTRSCNGDQSLCAKRFNQVVYATTHNSMSDKSYPGGWLFPEQDGPVSAQLADGVRGLMLDVYYGFPGARVYTDGDLSSPGVRDSLYEEFGREFVAAADRIRRTISEPKPGATRKMYLCHGFCELGATPIEETFSQIRDFLDANPREVAVIVFQDYVPTADLAAEIERAGLEDFVYKGPIGEPWPTLETMIDDGGRLVLLNERNTSPAVPWIHPAYDVMQETPFKFSTLAKLKSPSSCESGRGEDTNSVFLVNHWIDTAPAPRPSNARRANSRDVLLPRVERCEKLRGRKANLVAVDFYGQGDLMQVVDKLNGVE